MHQINYQKLNLAQKILSVVFIVLIVVLNIGLIFKAVRKQKFFSLAKSMLLISLAIGDIIFALFPLVVYAQLFFGDETDSCTTSITSYTYHEWVIGFVYGAGLITLAFEFVIRDKWKNVLASKLHVLSGFIFSFLPWFLVLVFVLPLSMAGIKWSTCEYRFSESRVNAMYWICDIVSPVLALIICIVTMFTKRFNQHTMSVGVSNPIYNYPATQPPPQNYNSITTTQNSQHLNAATPKTGKVVYQGQVHSFNGAPDYSKNNPNIFVPLTQTLTLTIRTNQFTEKVVLMLSAIAYLVCVIPYGAFNLTVYTTSSEYLPVVLGTTFLWLFNFRPILTTCIWLAGFLNLRQNPQGIIYGR